MNWREKKARMVCRTMSVDVTRVIPILCATSVATDDFPVPVAPPTRSTSGRSSSRSACQRRTGLRTASSPSCSPTTAAATS